MHHYAIVMNSPQLWGEATFATKQAALDSYDVSYMFGGTVTLFQGNFPEHGRATPIGRVYTLHTAHFAPNGECICEE